MPLAIIVSIPAAFALAAVYAYFCAAMPRSGGDYIFVSRVLHPVVGLYSSMNMVFWVLISYWPLNAYWFTNFVISFLNHVGLTGAYEFWMEPTRFFIFGVGCILVASIVMIFGLRRYFRLQLVLCLLGFAGTAILIGELFGHAVDFRSLFNSWGMQYTGSPDSYDFIIKESVNAGFSPFAGWTGTGFLGSIAILWYVMGFPMWSNYYAGEIKKGGAVRTHMFAMGGTAIVGGLILLVIAVGLVTMTGWDFYSAFSYLSLSPPEGWKIPITADYYNLVRIVEANPTVLAIIDIAFACFGFMMFPINIILFSRLGFAWSFDRIAPSMFSDVDRRYGAPVKTIVFFSILGIFSWWFFLYSGMFSLVAASTCGSLVSFLIVCIAGMVFPYRMKEMYDASPSKKEIAGIPAITIVSAIALAFQLIMMGLYLWDPGLRALSISESVVIIVVALLLVVMAIFYGARAYHLKKEGIDIMWAFKQLPPS